MQGVNQFLEKMKENKPATSKYNEYLQNNRSETIVKDIIKNKFNMHHKLLRDIQNLIYEKTKKIYIYLSEIYFIFLDMLGHKVAWNLILKIKPEFTPWKV